MTWYPSHPCKNRKDGPPGFSVGLKNKRKERSGPCQYCKRVERSFFFNEVSEGTICCRRPWSCCRACRRGTWRLRQRDEWPDEDALARCERDGRRIRDFRLRDAWPLRDDAWKRCRDARQPCCDALQLAWTWSLLSLSYCLDQWAEVMFFPPANYYEMVWWRMPSGVCGFLVQGSPYSALEGFFE
jgi:hypothetical protein